MSQLQASRFFPSERQKQILRHYRKNKNMVSLTQHILIDQCQIESDVPLSYIKSWIGNQNAKDKGKRFGGAHYKQVGKPRMINGYNLFCSETPFPENLKGATLTTKNKWWKAQWDALSLCEQNEYNLRAKMTSKEQTTESLSGEPLQLRKEFLIKRVNYYLHELSKGGAEGFAMFWTGEKMAYVASKYGRSFLHKQAVRSEETLANLKSFVTRAKETSFSTPQDSEAPTAESDATLSSEAVTTTLDSHLVQEMITPAAAATALGPSIITQHQHSQDTEVDVTTSPGSPEPQDQFDEVLELEEVPELEGVKTFTVQVVSLSSENNLQDSVMAGPLQSDNEDEVSEGNNTSAEAFIENPQPMKKTVAEANSPKGRDSHILKKDLIGRAVEELYTTDDPLDPKKWYQGTIIQRTKGQLAIKFLGERKLRNITVFVVKQMLKEKTLRFVEK